MTVVTKLKQAIQLGQEPNEKLHALGCRDDYAEAWRHIAVGCLEISLMTADSLDAVCQTR